MAIQSGEPSATLSADARRRSYVSKDQVTLLLAEPDAALCADVTSHLENGFLRVQSCRTAHEVLFLVGRLKPSLVIMRATLSDASAADIIATVREHDDVPIIVSVGAGETDLAGPALLVGASSLTDHPYRKSELRQLVARHMDIIETAMLQAARIEIGAVTLDGPAYAAWVGDRRLPLTTREFEVLQLLMNRAERVVSFDEIRDIVWAARGEDVTRQTVSVHIHRLREHLASAAEIAAVRGVGYRFSV